VWTFYGQGKRGAINADVFYGRSLLRKLKDFLKSDLLKDYKICAKDSATFTR